MISAMDPRKTLAEMVPQNSLPDRIAKRVAEIPSENGGAAYLTVHMAFKGQLSYARMQARRRDDIDLRQRGDADRLVPRGDGRRRRRAATTGRMPRPDAVCRRSLPTGPDPSQAPAGQDTIYLWAGWAPAASQFAGGLEPRVHRPRRPGVWSSRPAVTSDGFDELEIGRFVEAWPRSSRSCTRVPNGNPYYVDLLFQRNGPMRPALGLGAATPLRSMAST